jgi:hypothetical protein
VLAAVLRGQICDANNLQSLKSAELHYSGCRIGKRSTDCCSSSSSSSSRRQADTRCFVLEELSMGARYASMDYNTIKPH